MFINLKLLLTGGTGSFGKAFVNNALRDNKYSKIYIYSRDEQKQWEMSNTICDERVEYIIGDIRDKERLIWSAKNKDVIIHAAANKIVPTAELNPIECIRTNIDGANNVIIAARENNIKKVLALSTDKASNPINLYGATKLASDKLFVAQVVNSQEEITKFSIVRYGNVVGSRGSVIPFFKSLPNDVPTPITDERMTRFMIFMNHAINFVNLSLSQMSGGEIFVPKIPSMNILEIAKAVRPGKPFKNIGIRPGEKLHEQMIGQDDSLTTYEYQNHYRILPMLENLHKNKNLVAEGKLVNPEFSYTSANNTSWIKAEELRSKI